MAYLQAEGIQYLKADKIGVWNLSHRILHFCSNLNDYQFGRKLAILMINLGVHWEKIQSDDYLYGWFNYGNSDKFSFAKKVMQIIFSDWATNWK